MTPSTEPIHIDVFVPPDQVEDAWRPRSPLAVTVSDLNAPEDWTLADSEGNGVDVAG